MTATAIQPAEQTRPAASTGRKRVQGGLLDPRMLWRSTPDALRKLNPRTLWRNPVMFIVEIGAAWSTVLAMAAPSWFAWLAVIWLWLTVLFANLAEAVAEGRGKAQAETLRRAKTQTVARRLKDWVPGPPRSRKRSPRRNCDRATSSWSRPARRSPATVTWWKALPPWTNRPSRASRRR